MAARRCSFQRVTSWPPRRILPESSGNVPATAFSSDDFPEPLVPRTMVNEPSPSSRFTPCNARTSFGVSGLKVLRACAISSMGDLVLPCLHTAHGLWQHKRQKHEECRDQFQVVRIQAPAQRD